MELSICVVSGNHEEFDAEFVGKLVDFLLGRLHGRGMVFAGYPEGLGSDETEARFWQMLLGILQHFPFHGQVTSR